MSAKAKVHVVSIGTESHLVMAHTKAGAVRDLLEHLRDNGTVSADLATGYDIFCAGRDGIEIIGLDKYQRQEDPNQMPLDGVPEAAEGTAPASPF